MCRKKDKILRYLCAMMQRVDVFHHRSFFLKCKLLVTLAILLCAFVAKSQEEMNIYGVVSDAMSSSKLAEVKVTVIKDGAQHNTFTTRANGKYEFYLDVSSNYELLFEKDGFVKRSIIIDSRNVPPELVGAGIIMPTDMSMYELTEALKAVDLSVFKQPIGKAKYDPAQDDLVWDFEHTNKVKAQIFAVIREAEKKQKELDKEASAEEKAAQAEQEKFNQLVKDGDGAMTKNNFGDAVLNYKAALAIKPDDLAVKGKLGDAETKLKAKVGAEKLDADYSAALDAGDGFMRTEEFKKAIDEYQKASALKPDEKYPKDQIAVATKTLEERAANLAQQEKFNKLMTKGDEALAGKEYEAALGSYNEALALIPDNKEVQRKIEETNAAIANQAKIAAQQEQYDALIAAADKAYQAKDYKKAITDYNGALAIDAAAEYPASQVALAEAEIAALANAAEKQEAFDKIMADGKASMTEANYKDAVAQYTEALGLIADEPTAKAKLAEAQGLLAEENAKEENKANYEALIKEADGLFKDEAYAEAKTKYTAAREFFPEETFALEQITKINKLIAENAELAAMEKKYTDAMSAASASMGEAKYSAAVQSYSLALEAKAGDKDAQKGLEDANEQLAALQASAALDEEYNAIIAKADGAFAKENYAAAIPDYEAALKIKADETYPADQIEAAHAAIAQKELQANEAAAEAELLAKFEAAVAAGDAAVTAKDYPEGIAKYEEALGLKADDVGVNKKLEAARLALAERQKNMAVDEQYNEAITRADAKRDEGALDEAIAAYTAASELKTSEAYPKEQIKRIEEERAAKAAQMAAAAEKEKSEAIAALILEGDGLVKQKTFDAAIIKYEEALALEPSRSDIQAKIDAAASANLARLEKAGIDEAYAAAIADADAQFENENYSEAKSGYEQASQTKPAETYPQERIAEIDAIVAANAEAAERERLANLQEDFNAFIESGNKLFDKEKYEKALEDYTTALGYIPDSELALEKIALVNQKLGELDDAAAAEQKYVQLVETGDQLFDEAQYEMARLKFLDAQAMKPDEKYPPKKISDIDRALEKLRIAEEAQELQDVEASYTAALREGDASFAAKEYQKAIASFEKALTIKSAEIYPQSQIERIELLIAENEALEAERRRKEKERLAAEKKAQELADSRSTVNSNSEEQAEQFMRDAREAQEKERYERVRKMKLQNTKAQQDYREDAAMQRASNGASLEIYRNGDEQYSEAIAQQDAKIKNSMRYKEVLLQNKRDRIDTEKVQRDDAYASIEGVREAAAKRSSELQANQRENAQQELDLKQEQLEQMQDWSKLSSVSKLEAYERIKEAKADAVVRNETADARREAQISDFQNVKKRNTDQAQKLARENRAVNKQKSDDLQEFAEERSAKTIEAADEKVKSGAKQIEQQRTSYRNALDDKKVMAEERRKENKEALEGMQSSKPKAYSEYFRTDLAENYPQGVSEESSTLGNKVIITRIVVKGNKGDEYKKVLDKAGNYYFKNGQSISENTWDRDTIEAFEQGKD